MDLLKLATKNATNEIDKCKNNKLHLTAFLIKRNIELVKNNPVKFKKQFINLYI